MSAAPRPAVAPKPAGVGSAAGTLGLLPQLRPPQAALEALQVLAALQQSGELNKLRLCWMGVDESVLC